MSQGRKHINHSDRVRTAAQHTLHFATARPTARSGASSQFLQRPSEFSTRLKNSQKTAASVQLPPEPKETDRIFRENPKSRPSSCSGQNPQQPEGLESKSQYTRSMPSCVSKTDIKTTFSAIVLFSHLLGLGHLGQDTCECHFVGCHAVSTHELQQLRSHDPPPRLRGSVYKVRHEPDVCRDTHGSRLEPSTSVGQTDR